MEFENHHHTTGTDKDGHVVLATQNVSYVDQITARQQIPQHQKTTMKIRAIALSLQWSPGREQEVTGWPVMLPDK